MKEKKEHVSMAQTSRFDSFGPYLLVVTAIFHLALVVICLSL